MFLFSVTGTMGDWGRAGQRMGWAYMMYVTLHDASTEGQNKCGMFGFLYFRTCNLPTRKRRYGLISLKYQRERLERRFCVCRIDPLSENTKCRDFAIPLESSLQNSNSKPSPDRHGYECCRETCEVATRTLMLLCRNGKQVLEL